MVVVVGGGAAHQGLGPHLQIEFTISSGNVRDSRQMNTVPGRIQVPHYLGIPGRTIKQDSQSLRSRTFDRATVSNTS